MDHILIFSPHPDDEAIGCGGTLRRHVLSGDVVHAVFLTSGEGGGHGRNPEQTASLREREACAAATILGLEPPEFWREPDGALEVTEALVARVRRLIMTWKPSIIYVTHEDETHPDHRAASALVGGAMRASPPIQPTPEVRMYEVWTPLQAFDHIEDISEAIPTKLAAIRAHASQCAVMRFDAAILGLNRYRGEMHSWPGGPYAEVFRRMSL
jgi:LmbE family N-acetylglucosaminyl deacetylase